MAMEEYAAFLRALKRIVCVLQALRWLVCEVAINAHFALPVMFSV